MRSNNYIHIVLTHNKHSVLFMGHRQTVQIPIRHHIMRCLIRIIIVGLHNLKLKLGGGGGGRGLKNITQHPLIGNGLVKLIGVGNSIRLKWVIIYSCTGQDKHIFLSYLIYTISLRRFIACPQHLFWLKRRKFV